MFCQPARGDAEAYAFAELEPNARKCDRRARVVEQYGEPQRDELRTKLLLVQDHVHLCEISSTAEHKQRDAALLAGGESRHVRVLQNIRAVLVKADV